MAEGLTRKAEVDDRLSGAANIQPVVLPRQSARANVPRPVEARTSSYTSGVLSQLGDFVSSTFITAAEKQHQRSMLEGQVAFHQGETFEALETAGDKWALEGYRAVQAQTMSSGLMQAQMQEIEKSGHQLGPDEFRANYMHRVESMLDGVDDLRTQEMVAAQINKQLPEIVAKHTASHVAWQEQQNFEALEQAIDVVSRDSTSSQELLSMVTDSPATAGLSADRKVAATVSGVVRALDNGNFNAYGLLSKEGVLGDSLSTAQQNAVRAAKNRYEQRTREEYDADVFETTAELKRRVREGELSPSVAVEQLSTLLSERNLTMKAMEAGQIYSSAEDGVRTAGITRASLIKDAGARQDYKTQSNLIEEAISKGGLPAVSGGELPALLEKYSGDSTRALVSYAWTDADAEAWDGELSSLPEDVRRYVSRLDGQITGEAMFTPGQRLQAAQNALTATRARVAMQKHEQIQPRLAAVDQAFKQGGSREEWLKSRRALYREYAVERTKADVQAEISLGASVQEEANKKYKEEVEQAKLEALSPFLTEIDLAYKDHRDKARWSRERLEAYEAIGLPRDKTALSTERSLTVEVDNTRRAESRAAEAEAKAERAKLAKEAEEAEKLRKLELVTPALTQADIAFRDHGDLNRLIQERKELFASVGLERTPGVISTERSITLSADTSRRAEEQAKAKEARRLNERAADAAARAEEKVQAAARIKAEKLQEARDKARQSRIDQENQFAYGLTLRESEERLSTAAELFSKGAISAEQLREERNAYSETLSTAQEVFSIPFKADDQLKSLDKAHAVTTQAVRENKEHAENGAIIAEALMSGTLDQLPENLQLRALDDFTNRVSVNLADAVASGDMEPEEAETKLRADRAYFAASGGMVDPEQQRVITGYLSKNWLNADGTPNAQVVSSLEQVRAAVTANPNILPRMLPDNELRTKVELGLRRLDQSGAWELALPTMEGTNPKRTRLEELQSPEFQDRLAGIATKIAGLDAFSRDSSALHRSPRQNAILRDPESEANIQMRQAVQELAEKAMVSYSGVMSSQEAIAIGVKELKRTSAIIGGDFIRFPSGQSVQETFFGSQAKDVDTDGAAHQVMLDILSSKEMQEKYPILGRTASFRDWWENTIDSDDYYNGVQTSDGEAFVDVRPFKAYPYPMQNGKFGIAVSVKKVAPEREGFFDWLGGEDFDAGWEEPILLSPEQLRRGGMKYIENQSR